ncbi:hypothetical protein CEXT_399081 [Caerostris extrusa]|uniref:Uncharacterized protein n=1 Tax=Caerostris extrusa TaxID=172846 RepID=A0AAV4XFC3_CAEEX|nr:hypothetical protein CEXT_399081 [Caerostris extrusa]
MSEDLPSRCKWTESSFEVDNGQLVGMRRVLDENKTEVDCEQAIDVIAAGIDWIYIIIIYTDFFLDA